ncbi:hypothetical protein PROFUN_11600 [Planoprotostelium fungivorum]|uniref:Carboxypeptidase regulatory-like domain-containing protein n=1 Tax=Planoprotostelium fungivorum TaxID=1890364 RepID=A0A2P6N9V1_9EUKA|nr:hypothetical protein PROFUN_11600 [Planoprotostelium fungivorum]
MILVVSSMNAPDRISCSTDDYNEDSPYLTRMWLERCHIPEVARSRESFAGSLKSFSTGQDNMRTSTLCLLFLISFAWAFDDDTPTVPALPDSFTSDVVMTLPMMGKVNGKLYYDFFNQRTRLDAKQFGMDVSTLDFYTWGVEFNVAFGTCRVGTPRVAVLTPTTIPPFAVYKGDTTINGIDCQTWVANIGFIKLSFWVNVATDEGNKTTNTLVRNSIDSGMGMAVVTDYSNVIPGDPDASVFDFIALGCDFQPSPPPPNPTYDVSGYVKNAVNNQIIPGASVTAVEAGVTVQADDQGLFKLPALPAGNTTLVVVSSGFYNATVFLQLNSTIPAGTIADVNLSPVLVEQGYRIVLTWSTTPRDLDAHLVTPFGEVYYSNKVVRSGNVTATLDVDCTSGRGPETVTIKNAQGSIFKFFVRNYTGTPAIGTSVAKVALYAQGGLVKIYEVPEDMTAQDWAVFSIDVDGTITDA